MATRERKIVAPERDLSQMTDFSLARRAYISYVKGLGNSTAALNNVEFSGYKRACTRLAAPPQCKQQQKSQDKT